MNRKTLFIIIAGVGVAVLIAGGVAAYFVFGKDSKATSVTTAASDTSLPKATSVAAASSGTSAVTTASGPGTKASLPPEPKYTVVPISKDPFIPKGEELRPFYLQVAGREEKKYFDFSNGLGILRPNKRFFTHRPYGFTNAFDSSPVPMRMHPFDMTSLGSNSDFDPKTKYSQAEPVPGSSCNEFYIKVTEAGGPKDAKAGYICEKDSTAVYQGKDYKLCESIDESCLKFQAFLATPVELGYISVAQQKLIKDGVTLKNLHIPGYADQSKAANETWLFIDQSIRPASDPSMALTVDSKKAVSLKPVQYDGFSSISDAQRFDFGGDNENVSLKHNLYVGDTCEELYLSMVERQLTLVKDKVHFQKAEVRDIPDSVLDQIKEAKKLNVHGP